MKKTYPAVITLKSNGGHKIVMTRSIDADGCKSHSTVVTLKGKAFDLGLFARNPTITSTAHQCDDWAIAGMLNDSANPQCVLTWKRASGGDNKSSNTGLGGNYYAYRN